MHLSNLSPVRFLGALLGVVLALAATVAQANDIIVCKKSSATAPVPAGTAFSFTLDGTTTFSLTVEGTCMQFAHVGVGDHIITEAATAGTVVSAIASHTRRVACKPSLGAAAASMRARASSR